MTNIRFKKLRVRDLHQLYKWLNTPQVIEWYTKKTSTLKEVETQYLPRINGKDPTKSFIITVDSNPIGYIQEYLVRDDLELKKYVEENSAGLDLFIGDPTYMGQGLGSQILREFLKQIVFQQEGIISCIVDPSPDNLRMIKTNEKVGFKYITTTSKPDPKYLMIIHKGEVE